MSMGNKDKDMEKPDLYVVARFLERLWKEVANLKRPNSRWPLD